MRTTDAPAEPNAAENAVADELRRWDLENALPSDIAEAIVARVRPHILAEKGTK